MAMLPAGKLDRRVTLMRTGAPIDDGYTTRPGELEELAQRWAWVKPAKGFERFEAEGREAKRTMAFWMRHDEVTATLSETDAIELDGRRYEITGISTLGRREGIEALGTAGD